MENEKMEAEKRQMKADAPMKIYVIRINNNETLNFYKTEEDALTKVNVLMNEFISKTKVISNSNKIINEIELLEADKLAQIVKKFHIIEVYNRCNNEGIDDRLHRFEICYKKNY